MTLAGALNCLAASDSLSGAMFTDAQPVIRASTAGTAKVLLLFIKIPHSIFLMLAQLVRFEKFIV